jgi:tripartite ATP-independent transporter DctP family solute receptor
VKNRIGILFLAIIFLVAVCGTIQISAAVKVLKLAEVHPKGYPTQMADEKFAELVAQKTKGRIKIQVYCCSQLGSENDVVEQCKLGVIEFVRVSNSPVVSVYPDVGVYNMPYIFRSQEHMWNVLNGPIGEHFMTGMEKAGIVGLGYFEPGARNFYATKPLKKAADLKGLKIRVQPIPLMVNLVKLLGATPTPIAYGEVYSALQTGVVDGAENNIPSYVSANHYEVAKNFIKDAHGRFPELLMCSKKFWDKLSDADKKALKEAAKEATVWQIKAWNIAEDTYLAQAKAKGCTISEANIAEFQALVAPMYDFPEYASFKPWVEKIRNTK